MNVELVSNISVPNFLALEEFLMGRLLGEAGSVHQRPLGKLIGKTVLSENKVLTKLLQVKATVNSRLLTFFTSDQQDPEPLSPERVPRELW